VQLRCRRAYQQMQPMREQRRVALQWSPSCDEPLRSRTEPAGGGAANSAARCALHAAWHARAQTPSIFAVPLALDADRRHSVRHPNRS